VKASNTRGWTETVWDTSSTEATGSGCSAYIAQPSFQTKTITGCTKRAESDVSAVADPNTGVAVYDTYGGASAGASGWEVYGGTSASSPIVAALFTRLGKATTATNAFSYTNTKDFNDVTSGKNGTCSSDTKLCKAGKGWDGPSGNGTPNGTLIAASK
jgi:subtilase family serine protease